MRKLQNWVAILFAVITIALWVSVALNYSARQASILAGWNDNQMLLAKNAAVAVQSWLDLRTQDGASRDVAEQEALKRFIAPIRLLQDGSAWIYNRERVIYSGRAAFPAEYLGKSIDQIFALQKAQGADHYTELVQGVLNSTEGTTWYTWLPEKGPEITAWTSVQLAGDTWTIGLSTPAAEILANSGIQQIFQREVLGVGVITLLLWSIFFLILRQQKIAQAQLKLLEKSVDDQKALSRQVTSQSEELAQINAELGRVSNAKDEFLANMGHELRTPLSTIIGLTYALQCQVYGPVTEKQAKSLETILGNSQHLSILINEILDLSKIQAGKMKLETRPIQLSPLLEASLSFIEQAAFQKNIKISVNQDEQVTMIEGDEKRLKQVLINLLDNAVKFTPEGGQLGIDVWGDPGEQRLAITVWDTGIGIAAVEMTRLFRPFVQLDSGIARQYSGTGLGLSLAVRIAEMHGGSIAVSSEVGVGSRFTLNLTWRGNDYQDYAEETSSIIRSLEDVRRPEDRAVLLVVNNSPSDNRLVIDFLSAVGYDVINAPGPDEAIRLCKQRQPELAIVNTPLMELDASNLIRTMHGEPEFASLPVVILAAQVLPGDRDQFLSAGAVEYLQKPVRLDQIAELVRSLLKKRMN